MDVNTLSEMILNGTDPEFKHSISVPRYIAADPIDLSDELTHYGILGMKWGVRRTPEQLGHRKVRRRDRRYEGESDQDYQNRMRRESEERRAKTEAKSRAASERRTLRSQERLKKMDIKAQEKQRKEQRKQQEEQSKKKDVKTRSENKKGKRATPEKSMTDQEIRDAIARMKLENEYQQLIAKPDGLAKATLNKTKKLGGGVLESVGKAIAVKYLTKFATEKLDDFFNKKASTKTDKSNKDLGILYLPGTLKDGTKVGYKSMDGNSKKKK